MLVKATRLGYYNDRRQTEGSIFKLIDKKSFKMEDKIEKGKKTKVKKEFVIKASEQFSELWMEKVDSKSVDANVLDHAESVAEIAKSVAEADVI